MIGSRKGVISLPIKLTVSFLIISLMVPPLMIAVDSIRSDIDSNEMTEAAEELADRISKVNGRGISYKTHVEISIPKDGYLVIGGDEAKVIRIYVDGRLVGRTLMAVPVAGAEKVLHGDVLLELSNDPGGLAVRVTEL
jgi:hypothetical protein